MAQRVSSVLQPNDEQTLNQTNQYIRQVLHTQEAPPPVRVRYFYTSPLAIDDPLSPVPPPASSSSVTYNQPPRPFSEYDNAAIEKEWLDLRKKLLIHNESSRGEKIKAVDSGNRRSVDRRSLEGSASNSRNPSAAPTRRTTISNPPKAHPFAESPSKTQSSASASQRHSTHEEIFGSPAGNLGIVSGSLRQSDIQDTLVEAEATTTTGTPFIRAPTRTSVPKKTERPLSRPNALQLDSYDWDDRPERSTLRDRKVLSSHEEQAKGPTAKVPVGVSRLHQVVMDEAPPRMEPIYWRPVNDVAAVLRGTWFYTDTMLPVEVEVANLLEAGYISLQPWSETWNDELNSAVEVGALGEMKIMHPLWPDQTKILESRPSTSMGGDISNLQGPSDGSTDAATQRRNTLEHICDLIDISTGPEGADNKAAGSAPYGRDGHKRSYLTAGIIYANETDAYILKPSLQPSSYYNRRPLANYIRKGRQIGISVCRGFNQKAWDRLHPPLRNEIMAKAREGVSTAQAGAALGQRQKLDRTIADSRRPRVTDLVFVIHGIGQKLSERIESFNFTHAINAFRREVNVELGSDGVKSQLRPDCGGIMVLPVSVCSSLTRLFFFPMQSSISLRVC
jgi:hypothetical protein